MKPILRYNGTWRGCLYTIHPYGHCDSAWYRYLQITGPSYETKAESEMYAALGADIVGMSTACEAIALKQMDMKFLSISCITDYCPNVDNSGTTHEEVLKNAEKASREFVDLVKTIVKKL